MDYVSMQSYSIFRNTKFLDVAEVSLKKGS